MRTPDEALAAWGDPGPVLDCADAGLINRTWLVGEPTRAVLQWLNPIFSPLVNGEIGALTRRLAERGLLTPRLIPTALGWEWLTDDVGSWRLLSFVPGRTLHRATGLAQLESAGRLVGRFHAALADWAHVRSAPRRDIHDTPRRMADLEAAFGGAEAHPLYAEARVLAEQVLGDWARWDGQLDGPERICHGDLKLSNLRFDEAGHEAICLLDLDTVGPMALSCELGDAWRSWCNPAGEDDPEAVTFSVEVFAASARGFLSAAPPMSAGEKASLIPGIERICLELAGRFCADAVRNTYFREDRGRFPAPGAHNLRRAQSQLALARRARAARSACEDVFATLP
jgi:hypothetical protein